MKSAAKPYVPFRDGDLVAVAVQDCCRDVVAGHPLLSLHHHIAGGLVVFVQIWRPNGHRALGFQFQRPVKLVNCLVVAGTSDHLPATDGHLLVALVEQLHVFALGIDVWYLNVALWTGVYGIVVDAALWALLHQSALALSSRTHRGPAAGGRVAARAHVRLFPLAGGVRDVETCLLALQQFAVRGDFQVEGRLNVHQVLVLLYLGRHFLTQTGYFGLQGGQIFGVSQALILNPQQ